MATGDRGTGHMKPGRMKLGGGNAAAAPGDAGALLSRCLSLDLDEVMTFPARRATLAAALAKLDELAGGADFVLGHNLIGFDLPHLQAASPQLRLLQLPAVDTLRLNPLAFPRNPYHYLVKHYQDGQLKRGRVNDPELDARLALEVFENQQRALSAAFPDRLASWPWLFTALRRSRPGTRCRSGPGRIAGSSWTEAARLWASWRAAFMLPPVRALHQQRSWRSSTGTASARSLNSEAALSVKPGRWWCLSWCLSRTCERTDGGWSTIRIILLVRLWDAVSSQRRIASKKPLTPGTATAAREVDASRMVTIFPPCRCDWPGTSENRSRLCLLQ